jgi:hypothetical protein
MKEKIKMSSLLFLAQNKKEKRMTMQQYPAVRLQAT